MRSDKLPTLATPMLQKNPITDTLETNWGDKLGRQTGETNWGDKLGRQTGKINWTLPEELFYP